MNDKALYNSRIIDTYIKLIKRRYSHVHIGELLSYAGMKPYEVADQGHWFSQEQVERFYEKLVKMTGNENIAREAGQYAASPDALGVMRQYAIGLIGPASTFALLNQVMANYVRSSVYDAKIIALNKVEITVTPNEGVNEKRFQCENRLGFFEAIVTMFYYKIKEVVHTECVFEGGDVCRYVITWKNTQSAIWKKIRNYSILLLSGLCLVLSLNYPLITLATVLLLSICVVLSTSMVTIYYKNKELNIAIIKVRDSTDKLLEQIEVNYNNALITNDIGQVISKQTNFDNILHNVIKILDNRLDYDRCMILLANTDKSRLVFRVGSGYSTEQANLLKKTVFHLDKPESRGAFVVSFREQRPLLINDFDELESTLSAHSLDFAKKLGSQSFICCPIICEGESLGILAVDNIETKRPLIQSDMSLLMGIAPVIGISLNNATLIEARVRQFNSILQIMAASIDARDNLTAGHSDKVTEYAVGICRELGLSSEYQEMIRVASLLHDYGKIGVPDAILKKPGSLTEEERQILKSHAARTREILEQINFEGIYRQVPHIAGSHHEKADGSGYPNGLTGEDIPLGAKIIAVADFYEAITAKRHYRDPMPRDVARELLRGEVGAHFDKEIVDAFMNYLEKNDVHSHGDSRNKVVFLERKQKRQPCRFPVSFQIIDKVQVGTSVDISMKGMYVAVDTEVREGNEIELSFVIPDKCTTSCQVRGRVVWVNQGEKRKKPEFPIGFGVEFVSTNETREVLQDFLDSRIMAGWLRDDNRLAAEHLSSPPAYSVKS